MGGCLPVSAAVVAVDFHVVVGEVAAPAGAAGLACGEGDQDGHLVLAQNFLGQVLVKGNALAPGAHLEGAPLGLEGHRHVLGVKFRPGIADGAQHSPPVGVGAEHGALHQGGTDHGLGHLFRLLLAPGPLHGAGDQARIIELIHVVMDGVPAQTKAVGQLLAPKTFVRVDEGWKWFEGQAVGARPPVPRPQNLTLHGI